MNKSAAANVDDVINSIPGSEASGAPLLIWGLAKCTAALCFCAADVSHQLGRIADELVEIRKVRERRERFGH